MHVPEWDRPTSVPPLYKRNRILEKRAPARSQRAPRLRVAAKVSTISTERGFDLARRQGRCARTHAPHAPAAQSQFRAWQIPTRQTQVHRLAYETI